MDMNDGVTVAFVTYGISAVIAMGTAAIIALAVKFIQANDARKAKKAEKK